MLIDGEFYYRDGVLHCEDVSLAKIAADFGTPCYIYSRSSLLERFSQYRRALEGVPSKVCFAAKANSNLAVLSTLAKAGAGFDIVSGGELYRVLAAGAPAASVVFSGVGKTDEEIEYALREGIHSFNCESETEIESISRIASRLGSTASLALRVNPDVDASTHPYISTGLSEHKFGVAIAAAEAIYTRAAHLPGVRLEGVSCHIGSQILDTKPLLAAADRVLNLVERLRHRGLPIVNLDLGGGVGVAYRPTDSSPGIASWIGQLRDRIRDCGLTLMLEPGRSIVAESGVLLTRVVLTKQNGAKKFVIVDAAMNDLIRPSLYQAFHEILPVQTGGGAETHCEEVDVVGPVCETGDFFARSRCLPSLQAGDLVTLQTAGAYGFVLSSNYNSRPRSCELLVQGSQVHVARERERYADLIRGEHSLVT